LIDAAVAVAGVIGAKKVHDKWASMDASTLARALVRLASDANANRIVEADELRRP
jgi:hypothetical protein